MVLVEKIPPPVRPKPTNIPSVDGSPEMMFEPEVTFPVVTICMVKPALEENDAFCDTWIWLPESILEMVPCTGLPSIVQPVRRKDVESIPVMMGDPVVVLPPKLLTCGQPT